MTRSRMSTVLTYIFMVAICKSHKFFSLKKAKLKIFEVNNIYFHISQRERQQANKGLAAG